MAAIIFSTDGDMIDSPRCCSQHQQSNTTSTRYLPSAVDYDMSGGDAPPQVRDLLAVIQGEQTRTELMDALGLNDRKHFRVAYLQPALDTGLIEMTISWPAFTQQQPT